MATPNPGEPPIQAPVTDDKGNMTVPWHLWCVMMWKKIGGGGSLTAAWGAITGTLSAQTDLQAALNAKQASLGFTPENVANKTTDGTLAANSDVLYPSEKAVKTYVDGHSSAVPTGTGFRHVTSGTEDGAAAKVAIDTTADTSMSDVTTNNVTSSAHGFAPKSPSDATKFLNGAATPAYAQPKDSDLSTSDITTNDVSITKHGFAPKAPNDATKFLNGAGAYAVPAGTFTSPLTTKGDLYTHDTVDNRLGVGADGYVLTADSSQAKGVKWAQPSGIAANTTPSTLTDLILWYACDQYTRWYANNSLVPVMPELSMGVYGATNNKGGSTFKTAQINSQPAIDMSGGATNRYWLPAFGGTAAGNTVVGGGPQLSAMSAFIVMKPTSFAAGRTIFSGVASQALSFIINVTTGTLELQQQNVAVIGTSTGTLTAATWVQANVTYDSSSGVYAFRIARAAAGNGTNAKAITEPTKVLFFNGITIGFDFVGEVAELIVYNRVLSGGEITTIETYLNTKYGL